MNNRLNNLPNNSFSRAISSWYNENKRTLPWRETKNPYHIWLSEIILQQTRIAQGLPYYNRFVSKYPEIKDLADAEENEILRSWQGLGYYSRARNLHKCAKVITSEYHGKFPNTMKTLLTLPGIGKYTAAAIASLVFNEAVPVVDGNVYRVLARYFGIELDITTSKAFGYFYDLSLTLIDKTDPGEYNQAVMEFGALYCTPKQPDCDHCILQSGCEANAKSLQKVLPVKKRKQKSKKRYFNYFVIMFDNRILMRQRKEKDIWQGLYEFLLIEQSQSVTTDILNHPTLKKFSGSNTQITMNDKIIRHVLSHQLLYVNFAIISIDKDSHLIDELTTEEFRWYNVHEIEELPKPVLLANFLDTYLNSINLQ
jgi:A/G-specific adenine glycosylase